MKNAARTFTIVFALALALCATAEAGTLRVHVQWPIVVGDQVFPAGTLELISNVNGLVAVRLDGRQIALAFRESGNAVQLSRVLLRRDERGFNHLVGVRGVDTEPVALQMAAVGRGVATVAPHARTKPESVASR
jgi:hypothetical protein